MSHSICLKFVKYHLKRTIGTENLTYEVLYTILTMVEAYLNSRPLTSTPTFNTKPLSHWRGTNNAARCQACHYTNELSLPMAANQADNTALLEALVQQIFVKVAAVSKGDKQRPTDTSKPGCICPPRQSTFA